MSRKVRPKMPREQRAKQFAPFQAVDGLGEALKKAEEEHRRMLEESGCVNISSDDENNVYITK